MIDWKTHISVFMLEGSSTNLGIFDGCNEFIASFLELDMNSGFLDSCMLNGWNGLQMMRECESKRRITRVEL